VGLCSRCGRMSDDLRKADATMLCPSCREEDLLQ
jgi:DNA-directed RNA polymerase subunit RPC12/RpoP